MDEASCRVLLESLRADTLIVLEGADSPAYRVARALAIPIVRLAFSPAEPAGTFTLASDALRPAVAPETPQLEDVALLLHTSGTTGKPKVVPLTQRGYVERVSARARLQTLTSADRCLCVTPLFTAAGILRSLCPALAVGGSVVCTSGFDSSSFFDWLAEFKPTFYAAGPAVQRAVLDALERRGGAPRHSLRFVVSASAALPPDVQNRLEDALGIPVIQAYAMTEAGGIAQNPLPPGRRRAGSAGLRCAGEVEVLSDAGAFLPPYDVGEIVVRGPEVFGGYEDNPDANREAFHNGWFKTGDLGYIDHDGYVFLTGRVKELINRGGLKVSPSAVDAALMRHPGVVEAATIAVPHPTLGEDVVTAVVVREPSCATAQQLRDFAFEHLAAYMVPSQIVLVSEFPRTALGKVKRTELAMTLEPRLRRGFLQPRDQHEELVAAFFAEVLGIKEIGAFDNFFELGGDSLRGAQVVGRVNSALGANLPITTLFRRPTVAEFAGEIKAIMSTARQSGLPPIVPLRCVSNSRSAADTESMD